MTMNVACENFWGCQLSAAHNEHEWTYPVDYEDDFQHKLFVSQACLGVGAKEGERNIVEVSCPSSESDGSYVITSLKLDLHETVSLNLGFTDSVTFKLTSGSGPVHIVGTHLQGFVDDEEASDMEMRGSESSSIEDEEHDGCSEEDEENHLQKLESGKGRESILQKGLKKVMDEDSSDDEDDSDDSESQDESVEQNGVHVDSDDTASSEELPPQKIKKHGTLKAKDKKHMKEEKMTKIKDDKKKKHEVKPSKPMDFASLKQALSKMGTLPKTLPKFTNFLKSNFKVNDEKLINMAWTWCSKNKGKK
ncbi:Nucleoplasmin-like protein ANO39 [Thelohanellus kitauei]|uniref:Nucleoplasmin-like protein ANO39 n=1 Tax=Thelohanellus kitauei TaxID=669202 RepID=A0A0C2I781_THEKT|nr:Nucleoplasmin-like protein ANO39 [Thelohanellus kitauei]